MHYFWLFLFCWYLPAFLVVCVTMCFGNADNDESRIVYYGLTVRDLCIALGWGLTGWLGMVIALFTVASGLSKATVVREFLNKKIL